MQIRIEVLGASGRVIHTVTYEQAFFTVGGGADDTLQLKGQRVRRFEFQNDGTRALVRSRIPNSSWGPWRRLPKEIIADLVDLKLRVTLLGLKVAKASCPRCGHSLAEVASGGAYRSVARRTRACQGCGSQFLELHQTQDVLGAFTDATALDWFKATAPEPCVICESPMQKATFRTNAGQAEVERCLSCHLVVLEPSDIQNLT